MQQTIFRFLFFFSVFIRHLNFEDTSNICASILFKKIIDEYDNGLILRLEDILGLYLID